MAVAAAATVGGALFGAAPADAQLNIGLHVLGGHVGVGVSVPAYYYGPGYYPPGPCDAYDHYYQGDCGYAVYDGPIMLEGVAVGGPHYYRWLNGRPWFWYRGGWHNWDGWTRVNFGWDHGEGWGWHGGHWDRGWGNDHWRHERAAFRGDRRDDDFRRDHDDRRDDRADFRGDDRRDGDFHRDHGDHGNHGGHDR